MYQRTLADAIIALKLQKAKDREKGLKDFQRHTEQRRSKNPPPDIKPPPTTIY